MQFKNAIKCFTDLVTVALISCTFTSYVKIYGVTVPRIHEQYLDIGLSFVLVSKVYVRKYYGPFVVLQKKRGFLLKIRFRFCINFIYGCVEKLFRNPANFVWYFFSKPYLPRLALRAFNFEKSTRVCICEPKPALCNAKVKQLIQIKVDNLRMHPESMYLHTAAIIRRYLLAETFERFRFRFQFFFIFEIKSVLLTNKRSANESSDLRRVTSRRPTRPKLIYRAKMFAKQTQTLLLIVCDVKLLVLDWGKNKKNKRFPSKHASELIGSEYKSNWHIRIFRYRYKSPTYAKCESSFAFDRLDEFFIYVFFISTFDVFI